MPRLAAFEFAGEKIKPGEHTLLNLDLPQSFTGMPMTMPVHVMHGRKAGPVMFVSAAIHGDELNGVEIIRRLLKHRSLRYLRGTLLAVPMVNLYGVMQGSRYLPDRRDLNRSFPGSERGSLAGRLAHTFMDRIASRCDYGIDLHTGAINRGNLPQIRANLDDETTEQLARAFGVPVIINSSLRDGSLRAAAGDHDTRILLYEAGEALRLDEVSIKGGLNGVIRVMREIGMLAPSRRKNVAEPFVARSSSWVRAPESGLFLPSVNMGGRVRKDHELGIIADPVSGDEYPIISSLTGIVIGRSHQPLVYEGEALFHIGRFEASRKVEAEIESFQSEMQPDIDHTFDPEATI